MEYTHWNRTLCRGTSVRSKPTKMAFRSHVCVCVCTVWFCFFLSFFSFNTIKRYTTPFAVVCERSYHFFSFLIRFPFRSLFTCITVAFHSIHSPRTPSHLSRDRRCTNAFYNVSPYLSNRTHTHNVPEYTCTQSLLTDFQSAVAATTADAAAAERNILLFVCR